MILDLMMMELVVFLKNQAAPRGRELCLPGFKPLPMSLNNKWGEHPVLRSDGWQYGIPAVAHSTL